MHIKETIVGDVAVLELNGRLWGGTDGEDELSEKLRSLQSEGFKKVVLDMGKVTLMNSSGLGSLIAGMKRLREDKGDMKLANLSERVGSLLSITKLIQVFETFDTSEEAVQSFGK